MSLSLWIQLLIRIYYLQNRTRAIPVYDIFWFGVYRVSFFQSVMQCLSTLESCLGRKSAENHRTNIYRSIWKRISYIIALDTKNIYYKGSLKRHQFPVSGGKRFQCGETLLPLPSTCYMTLKKILISVVYVVFFLSVLSS